LIADGSKGENYRTTCTTENVTRPSPDEIDNDEGDLHSISVVYNDMFKTMSNIRDSKPVGFIGWDDYTCNLHSSGDKNNIIASENIVIYAYDSLEGTVYQARSFEIIHQEKRK
jgi:hypothetical protein